MSRTALNDVLAELPYRFQDRIESYLSAVMAEAPAIFAEAEVPYRRSLVDEFVFVAGVRKLWAIVDADARLLMGALSLVEGHDVTSISVGSSHYARGSNTYSTVTGLRDALERQLLELGVMAYLQHRSLSELVRRLADES